MNAERWSTEQILVYRHPVDMRKQMDGLAAIVALELDRNPTDCALYVFCNRARKQTTLRIQIAICED